MHIDILKIAKEVFEQQDNRQGIKVVINDKNEAFCIVIYYSG